MTMVLRRCIISDGKLLSRILNQDSITDQGFSTSIILTENGFGMTLCDLRVVEMFVLTSFSNSHSFDLFIALHLRESNRPSL